MDATHGGGMAFADGPKLELDELIDQLIARARDVQQTQGRLRALLSAIELVNGELDLERVLGHIAQAVCTLANARYAALGVIAHDGGLERFIHVGIDGETAQRIGPLPTGKGLLGALITDPRPVRLSNLADDPRSSGFPANHPPMTSFLGVPITVRGEVFGNLYLTDSLRGEFNAEDEELVRSLAQAAGTAISNARLYDESRLRQRWLAASAEISSKLMSAMGEDPLRTIARLSAGIADADLVMVGVLVNDGSQILVEMAVGDLAADITGQRFAADGSLAGRAIAARAPVLIRNSVSAEPPPDLVSIIEPGPMMVVPLLGTSDVLGVLTILRSPGRAPFSTSDLEMAAAFAGHASVALELSNARADQQRMVLLEDRDRIARDLHDHVIQQLFAIGLRLDSVASTVGPDNPLAGHLKERVAEITQTIRRIRTSVFELRGPLVGPVEGLRQDVLVIAAELRPLLGFAVDVRFTGLVDSMPTDVAEDVLACVREGLTNIAKYAYATRADAEVDVKQGQVQVVIRDDSRGLDESAPRSGLDNLASRALRRGGEFTARPAANGGTELIWKAPIT